MLLLSSGRRKISILLSVVGLVVPPASGLTPGLDELQSSALRAIARSEPFEWPGLQPEQLTELHRAATFFGNYLWENHLPQGLIADLLWNDYDRSRVVKYEGIGDSTTWTGVYLAVLAFQWNVTRDPEVLTRIEKVLSTFDVLTKVSGRTGYLVRYAGEASDPAYEAYYRVYGGKPSRERPGLGVRAYKGMKPFEHMVWLGHSSRDTYDGAGFGFAALWRYVDDVTVRNHAKRIIERIGDRLIADNWKLIDGQGSHTWHTFRWRIAWTRLLLSVNPEKYATLSEPYRRMAMRFPAKGPKIPTKYENTYYPANLNFMRMFTLVSLEEDEGFQERYKNAMRHLYHRKAKDHLNAHFAALYMAATGDVNDPSARATLEGMLIDYPELPKWARRIDGSHVPGMPLKRAGVSSFALLAHERVPRDFIWQRSPCQLSGGLSKPLEYPTLDFLLPYWIAMYLRILDTPK